jgi:hypothetical protein
MEKKHLKQNFDFYIKNFMNEIIEDDGRFDIRTSKKHLNEYKGYAYGELLDDKPHGKWLIFNNNFTLDCIKNFNRGILHGDVMHYYSDTQSIQSHYIYHRGIKIKYTGYKKINFIGGRGPKDDKRHPYHSLEYYENKFGRNYPIPKEIEQFVPEYYIKNDYYEEDLFEQYMKFVPKK